MNYHKARLELERLLYQALTLDSNVNNQIERIIEQLEQPHIASLVEDLSVGDSYWSQYMDDATEMNRK